jgi:hypothetical protein
MTETETTGQPSWSALRVRYEAGDEKVKDIAASAGVTGFVLVRKAREQGWRLRTKVAKAIAKATPKKHPTTRDTLLRLKDMLQQRVLQLEDEVKQIGQEVDALTSQRQIKSVNMVVSTLEKVLDLERKDKLKRKQHQRHFKHYDDEQRRLLAEKIARLEEEKLGTLDQPDPADQRRGGAEPSMAVLGPSETTTAA